MHYPVSWHKIKRKEINMNLHQTDPEYAKIIENFARHEVPENPSAAIDKKSKYLAILGVCLGTQGIDTFKLVLHDALDEEALTPVQVKEEVYQATDYLGISRVLPFLNAVNDELTNRGIALPLEPQGTTTSENRLEKGVAAQAEIFGDRMKEAWKAGTINEWLGANCFGDYYTRTGLTLAEREMITFCFLIAQGGCEPQATSHASGNFNMGNTPEFLTKVVLNCVPYIGYPRSLNAIACIKNAQK